MIKKSNIILQVVSWTESSVKLTTWKSKWFQYQIRITSKSSLTYRSRIVIVVVGILANLKHPNLQNQIFESQKKNAEIPCRYWHSWNKSTHISRKNSGLANDCQIISSRINNAGRLYKKMMFSVKSSIQPKNNQKSHAHSSPLELEEMS